MNYLKYLGKKTSIVSNSFYNILYLMSSTDYIKYNRFTSPQASLAPDLIPSKNTDSRVSKSHAGCSSPWTNSEYEKINWGALLSNVHWLNLK